MGGQVAGRDREPLPGHDEHQQPALDEIAGAVGEEGVLDPLVRRVPVVRRVQVRHREGPVGDGGLEQVRRQGAVEPARRRLRPVPVEFHAVGLHGNAPGPRQALRQLRGRLPAPQQGSRRRTVPSGLRRP